MEIVDKVVMCFYIDDLIEAYWSAYKKRERVSGEINIGGKENIVGVRS
ncbi:MAG: hypothetical protein N2505_01445 [Endomicrobia bacterium]|nr:hypothetical protein [Endomicrobiia bacterium]